MYTYIHIFDICKSESIPRINREIFYIYYAIPPLQLERSVLQCVAVCCSELQ